MAGDDDEDLTKQLQRYRVLGPPRDLRNRLSGSLAARRRLSRLAWLPAAAAAATALVCYWQSAELWSRLAPAQAARAHQAIVEDLTLLLSAHDAALINAERPVLAYESELLNE
jgi:hypothetical protein